MWEYLVGGGVAAGSLLLAARVCWANRRQQRLRSRRGSTDSGDTLLGVVNEMRLGENNCYSLPLEGAPGNCSSDMQVTAEAVSENIAFFTFHRERQEAGQDRTPARNLKRQRAPAGPNRSVWKIGRTRGYNCRLMALSRFKIWWMKPAHFCRERDVPPETVMLLCRVDEQPGLASYSVFIPMLDGTARCHLRGYRHGGIWSSAPSDLDGLELVAETGDSQTPLPQSCTGLCVGVGSDPYLLLQQAFEKVREHHSAISSRGASPRSRNGGHAAEGERGGGGGGGGDDHYQLSAQSNGSPGKTLTEGGKQPTKAATAAAEGAKGQDYGYADGFGWCTWDSCYTSVDHDKVIEGLRSLADAGCSPRWVVLDDGWQSVGNPEANNGEQWRDRMTGFASNHKFARLSDTVAEAKDTYRVKHFFVWHAVLGYWLGVDADQPAFAPLRARWAGMYVPPGIAKSDPDFQRLRLVNKFLLEPFKAMRRRFGFGLVPPEYVGLFYDEYHSYLKSQGVDGLKVDTQAMLGTLGSGNGGSVHVTSVAQAALRSSVERHFTGGQNIMHCMCHDNQILLPMAGLYHRQQQQKEEGGGEGEGGRGPPGPFVRGSDDFYPKDKAAHGPHLYANAFNALYIVGCGLSQCWDMFQTSLGKESMMHAAARAVSGGPIYVSDKPGSSNMAVLKKLVLEDGSVPRPMQNAMPTVASLFNDPQHNAEEPCLFLWNRNAASPGHGILAVFNIYGSSWDQKTRAYEFVKGSAPRKGVTACPTLSARDCYSLATSHSEGNMYVTYLHRQEHFVAGGLDHRVELRPLGCMDFEVAMVVRLRLLRGQQQAELSDSDNGKHTQVSVAVIGLPHLYNSGGVIQEEEVLQASGKRLPDGAAEGEGSALRVRARGSGVLLLVCSAPPQRVTLDGQEAVFTFTRQSPSHSPAAPSSAPSSTSPPPGGHAAGKLQLGRLTTTVDGGGGDLIFAW